MKSEINEYAPEARESLGQSDHKAPFRLAPPEPDITLLILQARRDACEDPDLNPGAVKLFVYLLDYSLLKSASRKVGTILFSTQQLIERLHSSKRAIYKWKRQLVAKRFIWISKYYMPNTWPMDLYHITVLDENDKTNQMPTGDGFWGNGARRSAVPPGEGARGLSGTKGHRTETTPSDPNSSKTAQSGPGNSTEGHLSVAKFATARRTKGPLAVAQKGTGLSHERAPLIEPQSIEQGGLRASVCGGSPKTSPNTHTIPKFEPLDPKMFMRLRPKLAENIIERCKGQIYSIEQSRTPVPNAAEIIGAYKARIKETRNWAAGQL
jgi:hypothetical protein